MGKHLCDVGGFTSLPHEHQVVIREQRLFNK
jgi:hypothetical protein